MPASRLLAQLREALSDPSDLVSRAGKPILAGARGRVKAMGLIDTGRLYASLAEGHPDNVSSVSDRSGAFGSSVPYAALVVARPGQDFMALSNETFEGAVDAVAEALLEDL